MEPIDIDELGSRVAEQRRHLGLSLRVAAEQADVPFNTLARVEKGYLPDLANFKRIVEWLGLDPALFFTPSQQRYESTTDQIKYHLRHDPHLTDEAAERIAGLVESLYSSLATPRGEAEIHLRAHATFKPEAAQRLGEIIQRMQDKLMADPALGYISES